MVGIYQKNDQRAPDTEFETGELAFLVVGNRCRALDTRRTPGIVEAVCLESATFKWRITDFEDKGRTWELGAEQVVRYQFAKRSKRLGRAPCEELATQVEHFLSPLKIDCDLDKRLQSINEIEKQAEDVGAWLDQHSVFLASGVEVDFDARVGPQPLWEDLERYFTTVDLADCEEKTAESLVLNPESGEWVRGLRIVLAEMGLRPYEGTIPRRRSIFEGRDARDIRKRYLIQRLAFVRAVFRRAGVDEVVVYRGMGTEWNWGIKRNRTFSSWTFNQEIARAFVDFGRDARLKHTYLAKRTFPVSQLFVTFFETRAMNLQYKESEALILHDDEDRVFF